MQYKEWIPNKEPDKQRAELLGKELNIGADLAGLLLQRGVNTFEEAHKFFRPSLDDLHDPFLMKGMNIAVERIIKAIKKKNSRFRENNFNSITFLGQDSHAFRVSCFFFA